MKAMKRNHGIVIQYLSRKLNELSQKVEQCFQSVSNGKALIASAITDKKVPTDADATFAEMAANIESLKLGSGNAVASDVKKGKTFTNADGVEYTGTYDFASETAATAAAAQITKGYTAWVNGKKITGTRANPATRLTGSQSFSGWEHGDTLTRQITFSTAFDTVPTVEVTVVPPSGVSASKFSAAKSAVSRTGFTLSCTNYSGGGWSCSVTWAAYTN